MRHHLAVLYRTYVSQNPAGAETVECRLGNGFPPHGWSGPRPGLDQRGQRAGLAAATSGRCIACRSLVGMPSSPSAASGTTGAGPGRFLAGRPERLRGHADLPGDLCGGVPPFAIQKSDRRAWVPLSHPPVPGRALRWARDPPAESPGQPTPPPVAPVAFQEHRSNIYCRQTYFRVARVEMIMTRACLLSAWF